MPVATSNTPMNRRSFNVREVTVCARSPSRATLTNHYDFYKWLMIHVSSMSSILNLGSFGSFAYKKAATHIAQLVCSSIVTKYAYLRNLGSFRSFHFFAGAISPCSHSAPL